MFTSQSTTNLAPLVGADSINSVAFSTSSSPLTSISIVAVVSDGIDSIVDFACSKLPSLETSQFKVTVDPETFCKFSISDSASLVSASTSTFAVMSSFDILSNWSSAVCILSVSTNLTLESV